MDLHLSSRDTISGKVYCASMENYDYITLSKRTAASCSICLIKPYPEIGIWDTVPKPLQSAPSVYEDVVIIILLINAHRVYGAIKMCNRARPLWRNEAVLRR